MVRAAAHAVRAMRFGLARAQLREAAARSAKRPNPGLYVVNIL